jgi:hypothetical protein
VGLSGKNLGDWKYAFEGDIRFLVTFSLFLFPDCHEMRGFAVPQDPQNNAAK